MALLTLSVMVAVRCRLVEVQAARRRVRALAERAGLGRAAVDDVELAVSEACTNAIQHGCPASAEHVEIAFRSDDRCVEIEVRDSGIFRKRIPMPELHEARGRGIPLMIALMDEVHITEGTRRKPGTVIRLVKCL
ncbi:MAG TPA: ATP-binding protein [Actinomycetota bacterium]|nr:ATP-binding protein [Actinomycetota bacterium]